MAVYTYKCPNCGGALEFEPSINKLKCDYCLSEFTVEEIDKYIKDNPDKEIATEVPEEDRVVNDGLTKDNSTYNQPDVIVASGENVTSDAQDLKDFDELKDSDEVIEEHIKGYVCDSCGAEVVTTDTTLTTFCYYCHNPVVITDRTQGEFKPNKVIPFKIDKEKAEKTFLDWVSKKRYVRKDFYSSSQLEKITGMYLPYWGVDSKFSLNLQGKGYKEKSYTSGGYRVNETSEFEIDRQGEFLVNNVSELAYSKVNKELLDSITPFNFEEVEPFKIFYLNGFFSETYDKTYDELKPVIDSRQKQYIENVISSNLSQYNRTNLTIREAKLVDEKRNHMLLPTWMLTYDYLGKKFIYALNGQTGKAYGDLPIDNKLIVKDGTIIAIIVFIVALLGGAFVW